MLKTILLDGESVALGWKLFGKPEIIDAQLS
jgi:hypothetical protein